MKLHQRHALTLALATCALGAQAQSGYTLSTLSRPSGYLYYTAATMDANGLVRGHGTKNGGGFISVCSGVLFDMLPGLCTGTSFKTNELSWLGTSSATQAARLGNQNFAAVAANDRGTIVGLTVASGKSIAYWYPFNREADTTASTWSVVWNSVLNRQGVPAIKRGTTVSTLPTPPLPDNTTPANYRITIDGLNNNDVVLVNLRSNNSVSPSVPYRYKDGAFTPVNTAPPEPEVHHIATAINDQGDVVGYSQSSQLTATGNMVISPVRWVNGVPEPLGGAELRGYVPSAINNNGQIILNKSETGTVGSAQYAGVWFNGRFTPISMGILGSRTAIATAQNNRGEVVGCSDAPFLWRNGQVIRIADMMNSSGLKLPAGATLSCPSAINDKGSILLSYIPKGGDFTNPTAIRLNAKP